MGHLKNLGGREKRSYGFELKALPALVLFSKFKYVIKDKSLAQILKFSEVEGFEMSWCDTSLFTSNRGFLHELLVRTTRGT